MYLCIRPILIFVQEYKASKSMWPCVSGTGLRYIMIDGIIFAIFWKCTLETKIIWRKIRIFSLKFCQNENNYSTILTKIFSFWQNLGGNPSFSHDLCQCRWHGELLSSENPIWSCTGILTCILVRVGGAHIWKAVFLVNLIRYDYDLSTATFSTLCMYV